MKLGLPLEYAVPRLELPVERVRLLASAADH